MDEKISKCLAVLDAAGVKYDYVEHAHADTIDDVIALGLPAGDRVAKNLFVRDDKKLNYYVLASCPLPRKRSSGNCSGSRRAPSRRSAI